MKVLVIGWAAASTRWPGSSRSRRASREVLRRAGQCRHGARAARAQRRRRRRRRAGPARATRSPRSIDLTIVGPEGPLVLGVVDAFEAAGLRCFGPSRDAAQLEGSKAFTKDFLQRHGIPTAAYATSRATTFDPAWVRAQRAPLVVKADGLAAGKGVVICATTDEADRRRRRRCSTGRFGAAGDKVVIEEFLEGEEASFIAMVDGTHVLPLATSQDHKRLRDGDAGPEHRRHGRLLAGAGGHAGDPRARHARGHAARRCAALAAEGTPYVGFLYAGLMIDARRHAEGARVQLPLRRSRDAADPRAPALRPHRAVRGRARRPARAGCDVDWDPRAAVGVVLAAGGYPGHGAQGRRDPRPRRGGAAAGQGVPRRHRARATARWSPRGGRVLCAVGLGDDRARRAAAGLRPRRRDPLGRHAVPPRHRLPRDRARTRLAPSR